MDSRSGRAPTRNRMRMCASRLLSRVSRATLTSRASTPFFMYSSASARAWACIGENGRAPCTHGNPRIERTRLTTARLRKSRWYAAPLVSRFSGRFTSSPVVLWSRKKRMHSRSAGNTAMKPLPASSSPMSTSHDRGMLGSHGGVSGSVSLLIGMSEMPLGMYATAEAMQMAMIGPKSDRMVRMVRLNKSDRLAATRRVPTRYTNDHRMKLSRNTERLGSSLVSL
mmetsp:Transcript_17725/g.46274  ORF Transcript_17725/g.46274 Transcript_17725/m.46274 type:complete len:225 (+) Transcript_17725:442-1116(+)